MRFGSSPMYVRYSTSTTERKPYAKRRTMRAAKRRRVSFTAKSLNAIRCAGCHRRVPDPLPLSRVDREGQDRSAQRDHRTETPRIAADGRRGRGLFQDEG